MFLLPDSRDWKDSSRPPSISLSPFYQSFLQKAKFQSTHPLSASALFSLEYKSLTPADAEFAMSATEFALLGWG